MKTHRSSTMELTTQAQESSITSSSDCHLIPKDQCCSKVEDSTSLTDSSVLLQIHIKTQFLSILM